jgi:Tfp pilus assembly protein PilV
VRQAGFRGHAFGRGPWRLKVGQRSDEGVTLLEVVVAFVVLMIALIPLSYLFTTSLISAGQAKNQQTALSIAEQWTEVLSNVTPPVNCYGEVNVDKSVAPTGTAAPSTTPTGSTIGANLASLTVLNVVSTSGFAAAPAQALVATTTGLQLVTYTALTATTLTIPANSGTGTVVNSSCPVTQPTVSETKGGTNYLLSAEYEWTSVQNSGGSTKPNLCQSGTPQLLKLRVTVSWGPNADVNNMQDSIILNYPPSGIQTLGFIALQMTGDSTAADSQGNPWSERVQAPPVTITGVGSGLQNLTIYPDNYGCAFAQVLPTSSGTSYTVSVANASSGTPAGSTYGSPSFVANTTPTLSGHVYNPPTTEQQTGVAVTVGAVTKLSSTNFPGYDQGSVVNLTYPSSTSVEDGVVCPGVGQITCISTGENSSGADLLWSNQATWSTVGLPAPATRIASIACAGTVECEGVGYLISGAVTTPVIVDANPSTPSVTTANTGTALTGVTSLSQIVCPSASNCVAIGTTASGAAVLSDTISASGVDSWSAVTLPPTVTGLTSLVCPTGGTGCAALGTSTVPSSGSPVVVSGGFGGSWTAGSVSGFTLSSLASLACPTAGTCLAYGTGVVGTNPSGPIVISGTAPTGLATSSLAWTADSFPALTSVSSLSGLTCLPQPAAECLVTGVGRIGAGSSGPLLMYGATTPSATFANDTLAAASSGSLTSITQVACPTSSVCVLLGSTASAPAIESGAMTGTTTPDTWTNVTVPSVGSGNTLTQLSQLTCWSGTSCAITAIGTNGTLQPTAFLFGSSGGTASANWSSVGIPQGNPALYLSDIDCTTSGAPTYCSAVGANESGAVVLTSNGGVTGGWVDQTPNGLAGLSAQGIPVEINNVGLLPSSVENVVTPGASANVTQLSDLYPFVSGYGIFAGCSSAELGPGSFNLNQATTVPGGTSSVVVPLGVLSVQALHLTGNAIGLPYAGATFQLTASSGGCAGATYTLQTAGPDGLSRTQVPYGSYTLKVTGVSPSVTIPVTVGGSSVVANGSTVLPPNPVQVSVT